MLGKEKVDGRIYTLPQQEELRQIDQRRSQEGRIGQHKPYDVKIGQHRPTVTINGQNIKADRYYLIIKVV